MLWVFQTAVSYCVKFLLDCIFFVIIDLFVKWFLGDQRSQEEKKTIWLFESVALMFFCVLIYVCDHTPYVLILFTIVTFVYTQLPWLHFNPDIRYWWHAMQMRWEEYQQHQDSMNRLQLQLSNEPQMKIVTNTRQNIPNDQMRNRFNDFQQRQLNYDQNQQNPSHFQRPERNALRRNDAGNGMWGKLPNMKFPQIFKKSENRTASLSLKNEFSFLPTNAKHQNDSKIALEKNTSIDNPLPITSWFGNQLTRRPLRKSEYAFNTSQSNFSTDFSTSLKSKFKSTFGFSGQVDAPPGLRNEGQNLCFMNSILQCLARTLDLCKKLETETAKEAECSVAESVLLNTLVEILNSCNGKNTGTSLDPMAFRQAASTLNSVLVAPPFQRQVQQDAAEFFMWLMDTLHTLLNKNRKGTQRVLDNHQLNMLKFIYGHLTPAKINDLKSACQQEINAANGFQTNTYAEPIQRLSDLEWLSYKQENDSIIDNLFTGQLVTAYHDLRDNKISVNFQTYNILPVTIAEPRDVSGLVVLTDCFSNFCNIEHLSGKDNFENPMYTPVTQSETPKLISQGSQFIHKTPTSNRDRKYSSVDSAISVGSPYSAMSPIPGMVNLNDSGYQDNVFKTSTPIGNNLDRNQCAVSGRSSIQRRCLLRQLPECLVIQLMRFSYNNGLSRKLTSPVSIPLKALDLTPIMFDTITNQENLSEENACYKYDLYGVCVHLGGESTNFGHYVSYSLQSDSNKWYKFDDEIVTEVNMEYELTTQEVRRNAYMLFYKKCKP